MATMRSVVSLNRAGSGAFGRRSGPRAVPAAGVPAGSRLLTFAFEAALTTCTRSEAASSRNALTPIFGLVTIANPPGAVVGITRLPGQTVIPNALLAHRQPRSRPSFDRHISESRRMSAVRVGTCSA